MKWYWAMNYAYDLILYTAIIVVLLAVSFGFQLRFFTQTSMVVILLLFFGWGIAQVSLAVFLSALFNKARSATSNHIEYIIYHKNSVLMCYKN